MEPIAAHVLPASLFVEEPPAPAVVVAAPPAPPIVAPPPPPIVAPPPRPMVAPPRPMLGYLLPPSIAGAPPTFVQNPVPFVDEPEPIARAAEGGGSSPGLEGGGGEMAGGGERTNGPKKDARLFLSPSMSCGIVGARQTSCGRFVRRRCSVRGIVCEGWRLWMGAMAMVHGGGPNMILLPKIVSALQMADRALSGEHTKG